MCRLGVCNGMTWEQARHYIVGTSGEPYWEEWVNRVKWSPATPREIENSRRRADLQNQGIMGDKECGVGVCAGMTWAMARQYIVRKHGEPYWEEWVSRVSWSAKTHRHPEDRDSHLEAGPLPAPLRREMRRKTFIQACAFFAMVYWTLYLHDNRSVVGTGVVVLAQPCEEIVTIACVMNQ